MKISDPQQLLDKLDEKDIDKIQAKFESIDRFLGPGEKFKFSCEKRGDCCKDRESNPIILSVYDVFRLRQHLGVSGNEFAERYGELIFGANSQLPLMILRNKQANNSTNYSTCVNLKDNICSVYENRPLVCRLYPIGRAIDSKANSFFMLTKTEGCCSSGCGKEHTIEKWLEDSGAEPFFYWNDKFHKLYMDIDFKKYKSLEVRFKLAFAEILYDVGSPLEELVGKTKYKNMSKLKNESLLESTYQFAAQYVKLFLK